MIGIKDTLETTAPLHGGNRIADRIRTIQTEAIVNRDDTHEVRPAWHRLTQGRPHARRSGPIIALPGISDELGRYRPRTRSNRAA